MDRIEPLPASSNTDSRPALTMADVILRIGATPGVSDQRQDDLSSAVRRFCRALDLDPASVVADLRSLRERLDKLPVARGGARRRRWNNVRSLLLTALEIAGIKTMAGRSNEPLSPAWAGLRALLTKRKLLIGLSRFMSFCSARGIPPEEVDAGVFDLFHQAMKDESLVRNMAKVSRSIRRLWNKAAATVAGWPALHVEVPTQAQFYSLPWDRFPPSLRSEIDAYLTRSGSPNPFAEDYHRAARPRTVEDRRKRLLQIASALVLSGFPAERVTGLACLVEPSNAKLALRFFYDRAGGRSTLVIHGKVLLLAAIARHQVKAPEHQVQELVQLAQNLRVEKGGMTTKNRERLRQFDDDANVDALLNFPYRVFEKARLNPVGDRGEALRVMFALAVEMLIMAPIRIDNLVGLEIGRHLVRTRPGPKGVVHVILSEEEVKNSAAYEAELPKETADLLAVYLKTYRPRIATTPSTWLFPNEEGKRRATGGFARKVSAFVLRETGITMNAHLFRHLAATLYLTAHPDDLETARRILGHKSLVTTMRFYAELKAKQAFERYGRMIADRRGSERALPSSPPHPSKRSPGK